MKIVGRTDKGDKRPENQDRYIGGTLANGTSFGFVCDGMGGANGGSVASGYLSKVIEEYLYRQNDNRAMDAEKVTLDAIDTACSLIYQKSLSDENLKGMGTTVSGVTVQGDNCIVYNVGDSRTYILRQGVLTQITLDHSVVQQLYIKGAITEEDMQNHPQKNLITRSVGVKKDVETDVTELKLQPGDRLLCASDGLTNFVSKEELLQILSTSDIYNVAEKLIKTAVANDSTDNITAVVLEY